jgi:hypothetical protein
MAFPEVESMGDESRVGITPYNFQAERTCYPAQLGESVTIFEEAQKILFSDGLEDLLEQYGTVVPTGSYYLDLMTWRDLDLYLSTNDINVETFFELGREIATLLNPVKMSYRNEHIGRSADLPSGLYWGVYLGNERDGAWKVDIWCVSESEASERHRYCEQLSLRLDEEKRRRIHCLKEECWRNPNYRKGFFSVDIYEAVMDRDIASFDELRAFINAKYDHRMID